MILDSSNPVVLLPQQDQHTVLRLGFENCALKDWVFAPHDLGVFHRHKSALARDSRAHCLALAEESSAAQSEFHNYLLAHLMQNPDLGYRVQGEQLLHQGENLCWALGEKKLWPASTWIAEDICLLEEREGRYILTAASVCSPSNWHLEEKIGQSVDFIHAPVPGYEEALSERVNRFLQGLRQGRVMLRYNWSIQPGNELYWRGDSTRTARSTDALRVPSYWRIERQTFLRLPQTRAIVFGIRIFLHSFASLHGVAGFDSSLKKLLDQLPAAQMRYKGIERIDS